MLKKYFFNVKLIQVFSLFVKIILNYTDCICDSYENNDLDNNIGVNNNNNNNFRYIPPHYRWFIMHYLSRNILRNLNRILTDPNNSIFDCSDPFTICCIAAAAVVTVVIIIKTSKKKGDEEEQATDDIDIED